MDSDPETDEEFPDPKAEPVEDDPPNLAVEGFRPSDYTRESFHIGQRVRYVVNKTDKDWLDGFVTEQIIAVFITPK